MPLTPLEIRNLRAQQQSTKDHEAALRTEATNQAASLDSIKESLSKPIEVKIAERNSEKVGVFVEGLMSMLKGDDGFTPEAGTDYFTDEEKQQFKEEVTPVKGEDYFTPSEIDDFKKDVTPKKGVDYVDGDTGPMGPRGPQGEPGESIVGPAGMDGKDGKDGKDASVTEVVESLKNLKGNDRLDISALRNSEQFLAAVGRINSYSSKTKKGSKGSDGFDMTDQRWHGAGSGGGGTVGPGTINEIAYFDSATTVASLTTATYPSLTELSYVKGVTSAIQTQLNAKGSGTVTSVSGTSNRVTSTGGTTPVIDISASYVGQSSITTLGTITTGVWTGTAIAVANGGTGQTTANAGFNALSPMTTGGDLIYGGASGVATRLANGSAGQVLQSNGTTLAPTWATISTGLTVGTTTIASGTTTRILYDNAGVLGEYTLTGTGTVAVMQTSPTFLTSILATLNTNVTYALTESSGAVSQLFGGTALTGVTVGTSTSDPYVIATNNTARLTFGATGQINLNTNLVAASTGSGTPIYFEVPALTLMTGANNIVIGTGAGAAITSATNCVIIGPNAGDGINTQADNTLIGFNAGTGSALGISNTAVGSGALDATTNTTAATNTAVGHDALGGVTTGASNTALGDNAGTGFTTASGNTFLGASATMNGNLSNSIVLGRNALGVLSNAMFVGGAGFPITAVYWGESYSDGTPLAVIHRATQGSGTDIAGAGMSFGGGGGTGAGIGGFTELFTVPAVASGSGINTAISPRIYLISKYTTLTESTDTAFASVTVATGTVAGGVIEYTVEANDATDFQSLTGACPYAIVNKGGTSTVVLGTDLQANAVSTGTLTGTLTATDAGSGVIQFKMNAVSSLTQTTLRINCQVRKNFGTGAIAAI